MAPPINWLISTPHTLTPSHPHTDLKPTPTPQPTAERLSRLTETTPTDEGESPNKTTFSPDSDTASVSSLRRPHRPPDLDLSSLNLTPISHHDITIHTSSRPHTLTQNEGEGSKEQAPPTNAEAEENPERKGREGSVLSSATDLDPTRSSTPLTTKMSGSVSERVSLAPVSHKHCTSLCYPLSPSIFVVFQHQRGCRGKRARWVTSRRRATGR